MPTLVTANSSSAASANSSGAIQQLAAAPPMRHKAKFFNIRGSKSASADTIGEIRWKLLTGANNPPNSPITDQPPLGPG